MCATTTKPPKPENKTAGKQPSEPPNGRPPEAVFGVMNAMMKLMLRSPLHGVMSNNLMLIAYTGRKSGKKVTTPVGYSRDSNTVLVFARPESKWWRNFRQAGPVTLTIRGKKVEGTAQVIEERREKGKGAQSFIKAHGLRAAGMVGMTLPEGKENPSLEELTKAADNTVMVRVKLR